MRKIQFNSSLSPAFVVFVISVLLFPIQVIGGFFDSAAEKKAQNTCWSMAKVVDFHLDKSGNTSDWGDYTIRSKETKGKDNVTGKDIVTVQFMPKGGKYYLRRGFSCFTKKSGVGISVRSNGEPPVGKHELYCFNAENNMLYAGSNTCLGISQ